MTNHSNEVIKSITRFKLYSLNYTLGENYRYLSYKYYTFYVSIVVISYNNKLQLNKNNYPLITLNTFNII